MKLKEIQLADIDQYVDSVILVHWKTGSVMPFEYCENEQGESEWMYIEYTGEVFTINQEEEPELIKSIAVVVTDDC
ncbi:hypothetical protein KPE82_14255 [Acinetobacter baumannii]|uniref:hypothetical protein n=1 Tax=Acinetobacter baumannii TaxID=470 RepID=UPI001C0E4749|nr:hypothetical protein [Acinetobacter baumannii]MBU3096770.1 hypothetical protein [Acinetobacter baumannii]